MRREMLQTVSRLADVSETVILYGDSNLSDTKMHLYLKQSIDIFIKLKGYIWKLTPSVDITGTIAHCALK